MKNCHQCLQNSIIDGVLISQMLQINLLWWYFQLAGRCIKFLINYTKSQLTWAEIRVSVILEKILSLPEKSLTWRTFLSVFFSNPKILFPALTISDRGILSLLDVFTSPLDLILTVN